MFSTSSLTSVPNDHQPERLRPEMRWILPAGTRRVLATVVITAALGLGVSSAALPRTGASIVPAPDLKVDINTVPPHVLGTLPHVGQTLVRQLIAARDARPIDSLDDAGSRVRGLGPATLAQIAPYLRFEPSAVSGLESATVATEDHPAPKPPAGRAKTVRPRKRKLAPVQSRLVLRSSEEPGPG